MKKVVGILFALVIASGVLAEIFYRSCWMWGESMCGAVFFYTLIVLTTVLVMLAGYGLYLLFRKGDQPMTSAEYYDEEYGIPEEERPAFIISLVIIGIVMIPYYDAKDYIASLGKRVASAFSRKKKENNR